MMAMAIMMPAAMRPIRRTSTTPCNTRRRTLAVSSAFLAASTAARSSGPETIRCPCRTAGSFGRFLAIEHQDPGVDRGALMQGGPDRPVQAILQVEGPLVLHHVREKVPEKCGIFRQQCFQVQGSLGGHQFV